MLLEEAAFSQRRGGPESWAITPWPPQSMRTSMPEVTGLGMRRGQFSGCLNGWPGLSCVLLRAKDSGAKAPALEGSSKLSRQPNEQGRPTKRRLPTSCQDKCIICRETRWPALISLRDLEINYTVNRTPPEAPVLSAGQAALWPHVRCEVWCSSVTRVDFLFVHCHPQLPHLAL